MNQTTVEEILKKLFSVDQIINVDVLGILTSLGGIAALSAIAASIALVTFSYSLVKSWIEGELIDHQIRLPSALINFILVLLFFVFSFGYLFLVTAIQGIQSLLAGGLFGKYVQSLSADIGFLFSTMHQASNQGSDAVNINIFGSTVDVAILSIGLMVLIVLLYVVFAFFKIIFAITLIAGPVVAAFSFAFPEILLYWKNLALAGISYPIISACGLIAMEQTGLIKSVAATSAVGWLLPSLISVVLSIVLVLMITKIIAELFQIPFFDITGLIIGFVLYPFKWFKILMVKK